GSMAMAARRSPWSSILIGVAAAVVVLLIALPRMTATRVSGTHEAPTLAGPVESEGPDDPPKAEPLAMEEDRPPAHPPTAAPVEHRRQWLEVDPPDAEVLVDGETLVGASPFELRTEV